MALVAVHTAMNREEGNSVHPFFSRPLKNTSLEQTSSEVEIPTATAHENPDCGPVSGAQTGEGGKKRGRKPNAVKEQSDSCPGRKSQASLDRFTRRANTHNEGVVPTNAQAVPSEAILEDDLNHDRRKRRKTEPPGPSAIGQGQCATAPPAHLDWHQQLKIEAERDDAFTEPSVAETAVDQLKEEAGEPPTISLDAPSHELPPAANHQSARPTPDNGQKTTPKKKMLKVNKKGKLLSSPPILPKPVPDTNSPKKRRGRKAAKGKAQPTVTAIRYGSDAASRRALGHKIEAILSRCNTTKAPPVTPKKVPPKPAGPPKPTHPFFLGKPAQKMGEAPPAKAATESRPPPSPRAIKKSAVTPGKLRAETRQQQSPLSKPAFGPASAPRTSKHAGLGEAPWPTKETAHVRNLDADVSGKFWHSVSESPSLGAQKQKNKVLVVPQHEDLMIKLADQLQPFIRKVDIVSNSDFAPPKDVRLPTRLLTTGVNIQEQVHGQIQPQTPHPAVKALFDDIENTLTPFDLGKCESQSWVQKYAPKCASHVLQPGKEAAVLHEWLTSLTVLAVGGTDGSKSGNLTEMKRPPKKKRKKAEDDFIVDTDEEEDEDMVELANSESLDYGPQRLTRLKSLRRPRWVRNKNVVLMSGPNGCGKSATVYAVAKELGFEVFEINSGSRRSGKDIQDRVGDMTENHLVNHKRNETLSKQDLVAADDTDTERMSAALQKDIDSGRQGTMTSFFKSSAPAQAKPKAKVKEQKPRKGPTSTQATLSGPQPQRQSQKQSLILLEEADVLFEEDQQFWAQVTKLASQSKRPIVITCNNEALIPTHDLPLAAILRLAPPSVDLATDYLLALAGREGHILERGAVSALYKSKDHDLRASIADLNLWCQMSVGDRKGGLEWTYQRWPPGDDVDEHGRPLRVASKGTYQSGMGWLSHNIFASSSNVAFDQQKEVLKEAWADWSIPPYHWDDYGIGLEHTSEALKAPKRQKLEDLKRLDAFTDSISAADIFCRIDMPFYEHDHEQPTNASLPALPEKERLNYTLDAPVLQADSMSDFTNFDTDMFVQSHLCIHRAYGGVQPSSTSEQHAMPTIEEDFTDAILQHKHDQLSKHELSRLHFSDAFDVLAYLPDTLLAMNTSYNLTASSFDRTFRIVSEDLAPYVRSIVAHELVLEAQRLRLGSLLSEGGRVKRQRTTRAARVALEGGERKTKRRERWFDKDLNRVLVMQTAGKSWAGMGSGAEGTEASSKTGESLPASQGE